MNRLKLFTYIVVIIFLQLALPARAQIDSLNHQLSLGNSSYSSGDYATSIIAYQKAFELSKNLEDTYYKKDSLLLVSLKRLITVAGIGKAKDVLHTYFKAHKTAIYQNICTSKYMALQIGVINNYIGVSFYNESYQEAVEAYEDFVFTVKGCSDFRQVDLVQSRANAAMAYSKINKTFKAIELLPQLNYFKDSLPNWTLADYNKVLGYVKANTNESPDVIIKHYMKSAHLYTENKKYAYALDLYENLLRDYSNVMSIEDIQNVVSKSENVRDSTKYYHNDLYRKMMSQLGKVMLEKTSVKERNTFLKTRLLYIGICFSFIIILLLFYLLKKDRAAKNYFKKLYHLEKQLEIQKEKLSTIKNNFIKSNYILKASTKTENHIELFKDLNNDFPNLNYNIRNRFTALTDKEIQIIYCTLLNLPTKESADVLALTNGSFRVAKSRLIKKLGCKDISEFQYTIQKLL